jgi:hypothetical protein
MAIIWLVTLTFTTPASKTLIMANNHLHHPDDNGSYKLYLPFGTYDIISKFTYHQSSMCF